MVPKMNKFGGKKMKCLAFNGRRGSYVIDKTYAAKS